MLLLVLPCYRVGLIRLRCLQVRQGLEQRERDERERIERAQVRQRGSQSHVLMHRATCMHLEHNWHHGIAHACHCRQSLRSRWLLPMSLKPPAGAPSRSGRCAQAPIAAFGLSGGILNLRRLLSPAFPHLHMSRSIPSAHPRRAWHERQARIRKAVVAKGRLYDVEAKSVTHRNVDEVRSLLGRVSVD